MMRESNKFSIPLEDVIHHVFQAFVSLDFNEQEAFDTTRALLYGEMRGGKGNHGLDRYSWIVSQRGKTFALGKSVVVVDNDPRTHRIILDGQGGLGYSQMYQAVLIALQVLEQQPSVAVALRNSYPTNCLGDYALILARSGAIAYTGTFSPPRVALIGGTQGKLPTSGQAFAFPGEPPFVLDFAIGAVTNGDLVRCRDTGELLPENSCLDADGHMTRDASRVIDSHNHIRGTVLPRGGQSASALMAGMGILMMMNGVECGLEAGSLGSFISARRPYRPDTQVFSQLTTHLMSDESEVLLPGMHSQKKVDEIFTAGNLQVDATVWKNFAQAPQRTTDSHIIHMLMDQLSHGTYCELKRKNL